MAEARRMMHNSPGIELALEAQGHEDERGWHVYGCREGKRRGGLPPEPCLARCMMARRTLGHDPIKEQLSEV